MREQGQHFSSRLVAIFFFVHFFLFMIVINGLILMSMEEKRQWVFSFNKMWKMRLIDIVFSRPKKITTKDTPQKLRANQQYFANWCEKSWKLRLKCASCIGKCHENTFNSLKFHCAFLQYVWKLINFSMVSPWFFVNSTLYRFFL